MTYPNAAPVGVRVIGVLPGSEKGRNIIRYYGCYSNNARGQRAKQAATQAIPPAHAGQPAAVQTGQPLTPFAPAVAPVSPQLERRRWAMLIKRIYQVDPLRCPQCGGTMKISAFIEARQDHLIRKILQHCNLWHPPPPPKPRPPPRPPPMPVSRSWSAPTLRPCLPHYGGKTPLADLDPEFLEHLHHEAQTEPLDLPWD